MKNPFIRVTQWLGDIPVQASCTACADAIFRVKPAGHRPNREEYQADLARQFDAHYKQVHAAAGAGESAKS
jgi:hypothetical protein